MHDVEVGIRSHTRHQSVVSAKQNVAKYPKTLGILQNLRDLLAPYPEETRFI